MTEQKFTYELDVIDNEVEVGYEGSQAGRSVFSYDFDQPLDSVTVAREEDAWQYALAHLHDETAFDVEVEGKQLGDLAEEYFGGQVEMDVQSDSYVEVGLPGNIEDFDISSQDAADWIVTHLDEIEDTYAEINNIPNREPEEEMGDWIAEQTGHIVTNR
jgi:hypothetical protein